MVTQTLTDIPLLEQGQDDSAARVNEVVYSLSPFMHGVIDDSLATPPTLGATDDGKSYIVAASATGDWAGWEKRLAIWTGTDWIDVKPVQGMRMFVNGVTPKKYVRYNGSSWVPDSDRLFLSAQTVTVGSTTSSPFSIPGEQPNTDTVTYGFPIPFACRIKSVMCNILHLHGSDPGDWTVTIEDKGGGGSTYYSEAFPLNAASSVIETSRQNNTGSTDISGSSTTIQMNGTGPSTSTIVIIACVEIERVY